MKFRLWGNIAQIPISSEYKQPDGENTADLGQNENISKRFQTFLKTPVFSLLHYLRVGQFLMKGGSS